VYLSSHRIFKYIFLVQIQSIDKRLHGRPALAALPLIRSRLVIALHEQIQIRLHLIQARVEGFPERYGIKLFLDRLIEFLRAAIGLRVTDFGSRVLHLV